MKHIYTDCGYIQLCDLLFIEENSLAKIPSSIWNSVFENDIVDDKEYIKLSTDEELKFLNELYYIFDINQLDNEAIDKLKEQYKALKDIKNVLKDNLAHHENKISFKVSEKEKVILDYEIDCLSKYIKEKEQAKILKK